MISKVNLFNTDLIIITCNYKMSQDKKKFFQVEKSEDKLAYIVI